MVAFEHVLDYIRGISPEVADADPDRALLTLYLIDWKAAIELQRPVSNLEWRIENLPQPSAEQRALLLSAIEHADNCNHISHGPTDLTAEDQRIIQDIVQRVRSRSKTELLRLIHSTFPVLSQPRHAPINLVAMAEKYKREFRDNIR